MRDAVQQSADRVQNSEKLYTVKTLYNRVQAECKHSEQSCTSVRRARRCTTECKHRVQDIFRTKLYTRGTTCETLYNRVQTQSADTFRKAVRRRRAPEATGSRLAWESDRLRERAAVRAGPKREPKRQRHHVPTGAKN